MSYDLSTTDYLGGILLTLFGLLVCGAVVGAGAAYAYTSIFRQMTLLETTEAWVWWGVFVGPSVAVCAVGIRAFLRVYHRGESFGTLTTYLAYTAPALLAVGLVGGAVFGYQSIVDLRERRQHQYDRDCDAVETLGNLSDLRRDRCVESIRACRSELEDSPCRESFDSPEDGRECREFRRDQVESIRQKGLDLPSPRELASDTSRVGDPDEQSRRLCVLRHLVAADAGRSDDPAP